MNTAPLKRVTGFIPLEKAKKQVLRIVRRYAKQREDFLTGFTLLELLVLVAIIGILATSAIAFLQSARRDARDVKRLADLRSLSKALELYYDDKKQYPLPSVLNRCFDANVTYIGASPGPCDMQNIINQLSSHLTNFKPITGDYGMPYFVPTWYGYVYVVSDNGQQYDLIARLENPNHPERCELRQQRFYTNEMSEPQDPLGWFGIYGEAGDVICSAEACDVYIDPGDCNTLYSVPH